MVEKLYKNINKYDDLDENKAYNDLSFFLKCKTISYIDQSKMDFSEFAKIHNFIYSNYPNINKYGKKTVINEGSIYYFIEGKNPSLKALVLMGHLDVVPPIKESDWSFDPFSGDITDKDICGRGALDMKSIDVAILNAVEYTLSHNGKPNRSIYICFGHDEETLGGKGQWEIKNELKKKNANIGIVIDEGGDLSDGSDYKAKANILEIQVMEKGYLDLEISATSSGGHSSKPGNTTALTDVCNAITKITSNPFTMDLNKPMISFFKNIKPYITDNTLKELVENIDNNSKAVAKYLVENTSLAPYCMTTIAPTMIESDSKGANVLPQLVKATINLRLSSFDTFESATSYIKDLCKDINVKIKPLNSINASPISDINSNEYKLLTDTINDFFTFDCIVPSISIGGTDCCFYNEICNNCYRFAPIICDEEYNSGVHGVNEKVTKTALIHGIKFYIDFIKAYAY